MAVVVVVVIMVVVIVVVIVVVMVVVVAMVVVVVMMLVMVVAGTHRYVWSAASRLAYYARVLLLVRLGHEQWVEYPWGYC